MKRPRLPLYAQILLWFFVNLAVVGVVMVFLVRAQLHLGLDSLLGGNAGERLMALGRAVAGELRGASRGTWDTVLERMGGAYGVALSLRNLAGEPVAGASEPLPPRVLDTMHRRLPRPPQMPPPSPPNGNGPPDGRPQMFPRGKAPPWPRPVEPPRPRRDDGHMEIERPTPRQGIGPGPAERLVFFTRDGNPPKYWAGVLLGPFEPRFGGGTVLIVASPNLAAGGLFFEPAPWIIGSLGMIALSALIWIPFVRHMTAQLAEMTVATEKVAGGNFDVRVTSGGGVELSRLAGAINRMSGRLGNLVQGQRRFLGDIAHELCSPLARAQMAVGVLSRKAPDARDAISDVEEELKQLSELVGELLSFSKAALRPDAVPRSSVELAPLAEAVVRREAKGANVRIQIPAELRVEANEEMLSRALANVLRNAVRHASAGGPIELGAEPDGDSVELCVRDSGPGIPEEVLERVFEPFFRPEEARSRETGGAGLGLAIARTCLDAFGAKICCRNRRPRGLEVVMRMPRRSGSADAAMGATLRDSATPRTAARAEIPLEIRRPTSEP